MTATPARGDVHAPPMYGGPTYAVSSPNAFERGRFDIQTMSGRL